MWMIHMLEKKMNETYEFDNALKSYLQNIKLNLKLKINQILRYEG